MSEISKMKYPKINSIFKRDEKGQFTTEYSTAEIEYLKDSIWEFQEKIDGTNIRIFYDYENESGKSKISFGGRTENAQIPVKLLDRLTSIFSDIEHVHEILSPSHLQDSKIIFFGEGFGGNIQNAGKYYSSTVDFILFDVFINGMWLRSDDVKNIADNLNILSIPIIGYGTLEKAIKIVKNGFESNITEDFAGEGLVLRPFVPMFSRLGKRIIAKVKSKDFK